jgi:hypothetical protein
MAVTRFTKMSKYVPSSSAEQNAIASSADTVLHEIKKARGTDGGDTTDDYNEHHIQEPTCLEIGRANDGDQATDLISETAISLKQPGEDNGFAGIPYVKQESLMDLSFEVRDKVYHILFRPDAVSTTPAHTGQMHSGARKYWVTPVRFVPEPSEYWSL